jgi:hypothetical protein
VSFLVLAFAALIAIKFAVQLPDEGGRRGRTAVSPALRVAVPAGIPGRLSRV